jgi:calnexin
VHFIIRHKNPKTGEYEEKHLKSPPSAKTDKLTNLYTLIVKPDQSFQIRINGDAVKNGTLIEDFDPAFNPPKEIEDPKDEKPSDWVDEAKVADPEATKPEDWDEEAPFEIPDEEAEKPEGWLDDEPATIPDPEAVKPEDWDDEEDGDWIPPSVPNPKCEEVGCGPWERPTKRNPEYKGKWSAPMIDNPLYKGVWAPRQIKNPDYFEDKTPANLEPMGAIGFEIWTMQSDILFDNIYIGHSVEEADKIKTETFDIKRAIEKAEEEASKPTPEDTPAAGEVDFKSDPVEYIKTKTNLFITLLKLNPLEAVKAVPEVAGVFGVGLLTILVLLVGSLGSSAAPQKAKEAGAKAADKAKEAKDKAVDAATTGAEKVQAEVNKRTTRSSTDGSK